MDEERILELVLKRPTEEVVTLDELKSRIESGELSHYIGYEISGLLHIGSLSTALKVKDLREAGIKTQVFLADYHSWINKKLGGDLEKIRYVGLNYFKPFFEVMGIEAQYIMASDIYDDEYWRLVLQIGNSVTLSRVKRSMTIMGRQESESNPASFVIYPLMQSADIFHLGVDIAHAGMDQRKVHMLAIDVAPKIERKKPIALHTHLLPSLQASSRMDAIEAKMSKSKANSAIFIHDSEEEIRKKIKEAYCPAKETEGNPVFEILKWVLVRDDNTEFTIHRPAKFGGDVTFTMPEFEKAYKAGEVHPLDLKAFVAEELIKFLEPARKLSQKPEMQEIIKLVEQSRTR
ncbi:MAG: tyrosine--tRNA ligase [Candidatus Micrarchaeota archaeon]|nr:tyrosine--tRNA ligase [Candidatus Micrarchaeota archaeon]